jgi:hypothetical protein
VRTTRRKAYRAKKDELHPSGEIRGDPDFACPYSKAVHGNFVPPMQILQFEHERTVVVLMLFFVDGLRD